MITFVDLAFMNSFSVFPNLNLIWGNKVTLFTIEAQALVHRQCMLPEILRRGKMKVTGTASLFYALMLAPDVLPQVSSLCCYVRTEVTLESRLNSLMLDVIVFL